MAIPIYKVLPYFVSMIFEWPWFSNGLAKQVTGNFLLTSCCVSYALMVCTILCNASSSRDFGGINVKLVSSLSMTKGPHRRQTIPLLQEQSQ